MRISDWSSDVCSSDLNDLYRRVTDGDLDAAVLVQPQFTLSKSCDCHNLRDEPLVVLTPPGMEDRPPHELLGTEPFIRYDRNPWGGRLADMYLRRAGIRPRERPEPDELNQDRKSVV